MGKIKGFFGNVIKEMKKVRWPKGKETMHYAIWVFLCIVLLSLFFVASDFIIAGIRELLERL